MLFVDSQIYLIDFLDSFIDSPIIDLVKLKQDLVYSWSQELQKIRKTRMITAFKFLWCTIEDSFKDLTCSKTFKVMEVVNFLRIEPYVTSEAEGKLLDKIIKGLAIHEELDIANGG
jgi:aminoglycoside/choline kinase family phosphotransferase